jgi:hypothetical protein
MPAAGFTLFETAIGPCGIAWARAASSAYNCRNGTQGQRASACSDAIPMYRKLRRRRCSGLSMTSSRCCAVSHGNCRTSVRPRPPNAVSQRRS